MCTATASTQRRHLDEFRDRGRMMKQKLKHFATHGLLDLTCSLLNVVGACFGDPGLGSEVKLVGKSMIQVAKVATGKESAGSLIKNAMGAEMGGALGLNGTLGGNSSSNKSSGISSQDHREVEPPPHLRLVAHTAFP